MLTLANRIAAAIGWITLICSLLAAVGIGRFIWGFELGDELEVEHQPAALLVSAGADHGL